jgi:hypothetical protein
MDSKLALTIHGISFFPDPHSCIAHFNDASMIQKGCSGLQSYGTILEYSIVNVASFFNEAEAQMVEYTKVPPSGFFKRKLVVLLHGLGSNPSQFKPLVAEIEGKGLQDADVYIPYILQKGHAELDAMVQPIFEVIKGWSRTGLGKELVLVGISNGGRIARALEVHLDSLETVDTFKFVSIVGACRGSSLVGLANRLGLSWVLSANISKEMSPDSARIMQLDREWEEAFNRPLRCTRQYTFIASPHDWQVPDYDSTLPEIPPREDVRANYAIVPGHGHISIVRAVAQAVAALVS